MPARPGPAATFMLCMRARCPACAAPARRARWPECGARPAAGLSSCHARGAVMRGGIVLALAFWLLLAPATGEPVQTWRIAMVALAEDPEVRAGFEEGLAAKLRASDYDAVPSYEIIPEVDDLDDPDTVQRLAAAGVQAVLMTRPAAIGPGSTLESVKNDVSGEVYASMRAFAREISPSNGEELIAVIHTAIYAIGNDGAQMISSGAVWLDETVQTREEGIETLQNLIVAALNKARPAIRQHLGLPPLRQQARRTAPE